MTRSASPRSRTSRFLTCRSGCEPPASWKRRTARPALASARARGGRAAVPSRSQDSPSRASVSKRVATAPFQTRPRPARNAPPKRGARHRRARGRAARGHRDLAQRAIGAEERGAEHGADDDLRARTPRSTSARAADRHERRVGARPAAPAADASSGAHARGVEQARAAQRLRRSRRPRASVRRPLAARRNRAAPAIVTSCRAARCAAAESTRAPKTDVRHPQRDRGAAADPTLP